MQATTQAVQARENRILPIFAALLIGFGILYVTGHAQATAIHDAAHDVRHATGFPCH